MMTRLIAGSTLFALGICACSSDGGTEARTIEPAGDASPFTTPPGDDAGGGGDAGPDTSVCKDEWTVVGDGPVLGYRRKSGDPSMFDLWNDPAVRKEGTGYRMWVSNHDTTPALLYCCTGGVASPPPCGAGEPRFRVRNYEATSPDGVAWTVNPTATISPTPGAWDGARVETPVVAEVAGTLHMYYTGNADCDQEGKYAIGHATRAAGASAWTKQPTPVVTMDASPLEWGGLGVAEPALVYHQGQFHLYYLAARCRRAGCVGPDPRAERAIMLRTSADGVDFSSPPVVVLTQSAKYPESALYEGPSTPMAYVGTDGTFHLYYDVFQATASGPRPNRQVAIAHATSKDGRAFTEVETDILTNASAPWLAYEVRAPFVIEEDNGEAKMWFAGHDSIDVQKVGFTIGVGLAVRKRVCR